MEFDAAGCFLSFWRFKNDESIRMLNALPDHLFNTGIKWEKNALKMLNEYGKNTVYQGILHIYVQQYEIYKTQIVGYSEVSLRKQFIMNKEEVT